ncbi:alpha-N-acetylgalactosaminide alpha-2,6-sialyltransferase 2 [Leuresthes tenuis]|uniref:alpha-N-acetylgalactosaminide alpha-2,6-sialyltransferase 2 n=1 Tax=Leuresthes tenuis TaxID=355514 RepID=UPI003B5119D4
MTGMALQNRLLVVVGTASCMLFIYILCLNLEWPLSGSIVPPRNHHATTTRTSSNSQDSEEPLDRQSYTHRWPPPPLTSSRHPDRVTQSPALTTQTATKVLKTAQNKAVNDSKSSSRYAVAAEASSKRPTVRPTRAAGPTEPPFIGDSYMSEDVPPQTVCSDSIRGRVKDTAFGGRFLEHIPVLQWAKHVTQEQHERLRRYPGAHGWGGIDYNTLVETLSVLNSSANQQMLNDWEARWNKSECSRCAVVGNGGILKDSQKGTEIDGHHYVFRTNGAIIKDFEQDVGSRTTHYTFSTNTLMNSMRSYAGAGYKGPPVSKETRYIFLPDHDRDYLLMKAAATHTPVVRGPERNKDPSKYFGEDVSAEKLKMYHPDFIRYLRNRFLRSNALNTKYKDIYRPSTGAVMLLAALHSCDQVSAYGFMTPDYKNYSDHYYDSNYHPVGFFINHDLRMEMKLWQQLHQAGLIRLYMHH